MKLKEAALFCLDLVFPKRCVGCLAEGSFLCEPCGLALQFRHPACPRCSQWNQDGTLCPLCAESNSLRRFLAPFSYRDPLVRELIHAYKYEGIREIGGILAGFALAYFRYFALEIPKQNMLVPIPLHPRRERERGFNQAAVIAEHIAAGLGLPVASLLRRTRRTAPQITLSSPDERRKNVSGVFALTDPAAVRGKWIVLVDDVSTSGATLTEAARTLRTAGARTVSALAIAKG